MAIVRGAGDRPRSHVGATWSWCQEMKLAEGEQGVGGHSWPGAERSRMTDGQSRVRLKWRQGRFEPGRRQGNQGNTRSVRLWFWLQHDAWDSSHPTERGQGPRPTRRDRGPRPTGPRPYLKPRWCTGATVRGAEMGLEQGPAPNAGTGGNRGWEQNGQGRTWPGWFTNLALVLGRIRERERERGGYAIGSWLRSLQEEDQRRVS